MESWIWAAACSIRGAQEAAKYKDFILPLIFVKRLCDVFDDELNRIAKKVKTREKAFRMVKADKKLVRFYLPLQPEEPEQPVWSVIRQLTDKIGEGSGLDMGMGCPEGFVGLNPAIQIPMSSAPPFRGRPPKWPLARAAWFPMQSFTGIPSKSMKSLKA